MTDDDARIADRADWIAQRMDNAFRIPGTRITFGFDTILGLVPGVGDTLAVAPSLYIVKLAHDAGAPKRLLGRMGFNIGVDWVIGLIPLLGDVFDVGYKANLRNAVLLRTHLEGRPDPRLPPRPHAFSAAPAE
nr:DUF4112 domain-containing protein [Cognatishimia sp. F0-27]